MTTYREFRRLPDNRIEPTGNVRVHTELRQALDIFGGLDTSLSVGDYMFEDKVHRVYFLKRQGVISDTGWEIYEPPTPSWLGQEQA